MLEPQGGSGGGGGNQFTTAEADVLISIASGNYGVYADQFSGSDIGAQVNAAYAALPSAGGTIFLPIGTYSFSTPIVFGTNHKPVTLQGMSSAATFLKFTPTSGNAITYNEGNPIGHLNHEITGFTLMGSPSLIAAGNTNTNTSVGIFYGGTQGAVGINTHDMNVNGFGTNWQTGANAYMLSWNNCANSGGNGGQATQGALLHVNTTSNSGERFVFQGCTFTDPGNSLATNAIYITSTATPSTSFNGCSFDDVQVFVSTNEGITSFIDNHIENSAYATYGSYIPILGVLSDKATQIVFIGNEIANDATTSGNSFVTIIHHGGQLIALGNHINNYGGQTITSFVDHGLDNGVASDTIAMTQVQSGGLTNLIAGSGGVAYTQAAGSTMITNVSNSYSIGLMAQSNNTNIFFSGSTTVATFDHSGNWTMAASLSINSGTTLTTTNQTGTGSIVMSTSPTLVTPSLGVASATSLTSNLNLSNNNAITATSNAATVPVTFSLSTVTNSSAATLTITITTSGATDGQLLMVRVLDFSGVAETLAWVNTENSTVSVPGTTNGSTTSFLTVGFIYNGGTSKWRCIASA